MFIEREREKYTYDYNNNYNYIYIYIQHILYAKLKAIQRDIQAAQYRCTTERADLELQV